MTWLQLFLHAHPNLFGYSMLAAFGVVIVGLAGASIVDRERAERWRDWASHQRPRRF